MGLATLIQRRESWLLYASTLIITLSAPLCAVADETRFVARPGDPINIPGDPTQYTIDRIVNSTNALSIPIGSISGAVTFQARIAGPGIGSLNSQCIVRAIPAGNGSWTKTAIACRNHGAMVSNPSATPNAVFSTFDNPKIDDFGCVTFSGSFSATGYSNIPGYWGTCSSSLATPLLMLQNGTPAPGLASGILSSIANDAVMPRHAPEPTLMFTSTVTGAPIATTNRLLGKAVPGLNQLLACPYCSGADRNDPSATFLTLLSMVVGDSGAVALYGGISSRSGSAGGDAIWRTLSGSISDLELIAAVGADAPGMPGFKYNSLNQSLGSRPILTNVGALIHSARVTNDLGVITYGLWLTPPNSSQPRLLVSGLQQAAGLPDGVTYGQLYAPVLGRSVFGGDVLPGQTQSSLTFMSSLLGGGIPSAQRTAFWKLALDGTNDTPQLVIQSGVQVPDAEPGTSIISSGFGHIVGNRQGDIAAFTSLLVGSSNTQAYYITKNGAFRRVAQLGQVIPESGLSIVSLNTQPQIYMNDLGQTVFFASMSPDGSAINAQFGLVRADENRQLRIIATPGQILHPLNGPQAQLGGLSYSQTTPLLDTGDFVFGAVTTGIDTPEAIFSTHIIASSSVPQCRADFNHDGRATLDDLFSFLTPWFMVDSAADFNTDGRVTNQDLFDFIGAWFAGC